MKILGEVDGVKIVYTKLCPKGYWMSFFNMILTKNENAKIPSRSTVNHEKIHFEQTKELGYIFFYLIYCLEYVCFRIWQHKFNHDAAYRAISFEKEAYDHEYDYEYLNTRKHFAQWK